MGTLGGLEKLAPAVLRFPIEKTIKAFVNIKLGRKLTSSYLRIFALIIGLIIGNMFPQIGELMALLITLVAVPVSPALITGLSLFCSMYLTAAVCMYLVKKSLQYYYTKKYGFSNPEYRLTNHDCMIIKENFPDLKKTELAELFKSLEKKIAKISNEIRKLKQVKPGEQLQNAKYTLNQLKLGNLSAYDDYFKISTESTRSNPNPNPNPKPRKETIIKDEDDYPRSPVTQLYKRGGTTRKKFRQDSEDTEARNQSEDDLFLGATFK
ncbi:MAG: hypothetical protein KBD64_04910 [Gammaproteobacteria bacterium]|nr:hypothetical protein [Gammaproteobacteria bacterium]